MGKDEVYEPQPSKRNNGRPQELGVATGVFFRGPISDILNEKQAIFLLVFIPLVSPHSWPKPEGFFFFFFLSKKYVRKYQFHV